MGYDASVLARGLVTCALLAGCTREPAEAICPEAGNGAIVVTEVRGDQDPAGHASASTSGTPALASADIAINEAPWVILRPLPSPSSLPV